MSYEELWKPLEDLYGRGEAKAVVRLLLEELFGLTLTDIVGGSVERLSPQQQEQLCSLSARLQQGEPVQYVLGRATFCGREFCVSPAVLIPRPETEELCRWVVDDSRKAASPSEEHAGSRPTAFAPEVLDVGTGSGCIACTLAADINGATVTAWDISDAALQTAAGNARRLDVRLSLEKVDALSLPTHHSRWDIIVSNPPYVCHNERGGMLRNVLDYEPQLALFVPDDDPLLFYRSITSYASLALRPGGRLYFEINPLFADQTAALVGEQGFSDVVLMNDPYGKQRFIRACKEKEK